MVDNTGKSKGQKSGRDPTSKDPFIRAGMSMGKNTMKIFKRAGMDMKLRKDMDIKF